ncbi:tryptophan--tRNA ligase [Patescibacteria group bacterium]|nr:MAG: tryptophan--tRNA ligase [Patescibacteria group bacterium]
MSVKKILLSGIQPSGRVHIGNYFGAMKQFVDLQDTYESYIIIVDLHALTSTQNPEELRQNIIDLAIDYLAVGLDPKKITLYKQSDVPQVTELAWIFECITTMPYLSRAHAFKDAQTQEKEVNVGTFNYPMLMAADILIQDTDIVPVGQDQKQHVEISRDTAEKFNRTFGETFKIPEPYILPSVQTFPGTDGQKMSKSYGNTIGLFASDKEIKEAVMKIPTDSKSVDEPKNPETDNVFALHRFFTAGPEFDELRDRYEAGGIGYQESKEILVRNINRFIAPLRESRGKLEKNMKMVLEVLREGGKQASKRAEEKMSEVRKRIGITLP